MSRSVWFTAGAATGVYAFLKVKRTAQKFTPNGLKAQAAALRAGARSFAQEVSVGMAEHEQQLRQQLDNGRAPRAEIEQSASMSGGRDGHR